MKFFQKHKMPSLEAGLMIVLIVKKNFFEKNSLVTGGVAGVVG